MHRVTEEKRTAKAAVKKTTTVDSESLTVQGIRVNKVVAKDGKPLSADEAKKENERIDKDVAKAKERRAKSAEKGQETGARRRENTSSRRLHGFWSWGRSRIRGGRCTTGGRRSSRTMPAGPEGEDAQSGGECRAGPGGDSVDR